MELKGIHHVSAMTANATINLDFYTNIMGMRLVKKTVNQDDTSVYHLFYGDEKGNPGTELTFFEIPMAARNHEGVSSISALSLRVANDEALTFWKKRFEEIGVKHEEITERANRATLAFTDPEGQRLILVSDESNNGVASGTPWEKSPIPQIHGITGLGPVKLTVRDAEPTAHVLTELMGFRQKGQYPSLVQGQPDIAVYETGEGGSGAEIHLEERSDLPPERLGRGGVHHVAFRVENEEELRKWIKHIRSAKFPNSGFVDRFYFKSLYFREPNGILFELATDGPGFDTDEHIDHLGESLALPPFLEEQREQIEAHLQPLNTK
ncbi:ring-cleaving dioxygenase [Lederbergia lenta]|uniref:Glyoxalase family domain-containing protein n=1 Tax=Lederbergia lenta TaxID=1467 RepID=A0A2X4YL68_LEDLE|nr:ring-cleaving dioxygenase [Lederbergia lenta]MEC2323603.1 ring-cleaving dioxygenase [Lederbergia lenta]SQI52515.1 glyoxalase family domain-containing protein [Lederbergia lenta]